MTNFTTLNFLGVLTNEIWKRLQHTANLYRFRLHRFYRQCLYILQNKQCNLYDTQLSNECNLGGGDYRVSFFVNGSVKKLLMAMKEEQPSLLFIVNYHFKFMGSTKLQSEPFICNSSLILEDILN